MSANPWQHDPEMYRQREYLVEKGRRISLVELLTALLAESETHGEAWFLARDYLAHIDGADYGPGPGDVDDSPEYHAARSGEHIDGHMGAGDY